MLQACNLILIKTYDELWWHSCDFCLATCKCPKYLFTNYYQALPYISAKKPINEYTGLFPDLLSMIVDSICTDCKSHWNPPILYNQTRDGRDPIKADAQTAIKNIDDTVHFTFPIFGQIEIPSYSGYPFIGIVQSQGTAMIVYQPKVVSVGFVAIFNAVGNSKPVVLIAILISMVVGWLLWFAVSVNHAITLYNYWIR